MPEHVVPQGSVFEPFGSFITTLQRNSCRPQRKAKIHLLLSPWQPGSTDALEKLLLCFVFFPLLSKTETFKAWKNQQPPFLLPGAEEAVCDAANARYRKHNRSWCRPRRRPLALRICFCHESRMLAAVYGLGRYISPGPRIIFSG